MYSVYNGQHVPDVFTIRPDGSRRLQLTHSASVSDQGFAWSPNGLKIAYGRSGGSTGSDSELWIMRRDGSDKHRITHNSSHDIHFAWSPSGRRLVYAWFDSHDYEISTIRPDGTGKQVLTDNDYQDTGPDWSPLGDHIVWTSDSDGSLDIYMMRPDGTDVQQITHSVEELSDAWGATWSPNGTRIAYAAGANYETSQIYVKPIDGGSRHQVTTGVGYEPSWAPVGGRIAYLGFAVNDIGTDLYTIRADGTGGHPLNSTKREETAPDWGVLLVN